MNHPTPASGTLLPGRAVDIVHAATQAAGLTPYCIEVRFGGWADGPGYDVCVIPAGRAHEPLARAVFAALGVTGGITLGEPYGTESHQQADLDGRVPALRARLSIVVADLPAVSLPGDVEALVAQVDAARADDPAGEAALGPHDRAWCGERIESGTGLDCTLPCGDTVPEHTDCHRDDPTHAGAQITPVA